jgi:hypothetical protein
MNKLSGAQQCEILEEVPRVLREVAAERDLYKEAFLKGANRSRIEKVASQMVEKGLKGGTVQAVADELEKQAQAGSLNLDVTEQAVELVGPDMGKHAHLSDELSGSAGSSDLERFLTGG